MEPDAAPAWESSMKKLAVIGSINMDVVTRVERFPSPARR